MKHANSPSLSLHRTFCRTARPTTLCLLLALTHLPAGLTGLHIAGSAAALAQPSATGDLGGIITQVLPTGALDISEALKVAKVGQSVVIRGYVPSSAAAFASDGTSFQLTEPARTPVAPAEKAENPAKPDTAGSAVPTVTIKIKREKPAPSAAGLNGQAGLRPGAEVFVTGTVEQANGKDSLTLTATSIHVPRSPLPVGFFTTTPPASATDVSERRKAGTIKLGDEVTLRGRIGGSKEPFVAGRAMFTLMGRGLKACNENPDDACTKPWDYCCESKADIAANSVIVQLVDEKGQLLRTAMKGRRGIKELSEVVVTGKVTTADDKVVIITASQMFVAN